MQISAIFSALRAGNELRRAATWKRVDVAAKALSTLLMAVAGIAYSAGYLPVEVSEEQSLLVAGAVATLVNALSIYWSIATTRRMGLRAEPHQATLPDVAQQPATALASTSRATKSKRSPSPFRGGSLSDPRPERVRDGAPGLSPLASPHPGDDPGLDSFPR